MIDDFNLLVTTLRGHEGHLCSELEYLLTEELGAAGLLFEKSGIRGLIVVKVSLDPF